MNRRMIRALAAAMIALGLIAGGLGAASAQGGSPQITIGSSSNGSVTNQSGGQGQDGEPNQTGGVGQTNPNTATRSSSFPGDGGAGATAFCDTGEKSDTSTSCDAGDAIVGSSTTGDTSGTNSSDQSGANGSDQSQGSEAGEQSNTPDSSTTQNLNNSVSNIGGSVDNSVVTDTVTTSDNDVVDGDNNDLSGIVQGLLVQLQILLARILGMPGPG